MYLLGKMGISRKIIYGISVITLVMPSAVSCNREDDTDIDSGNVTLHASAYVYEHTLIESRALPEGYQKYLPFFNEETQSTADIRAMLMAKESESYNLTGDFKYSAADREWTFDKKVRTGITYYVYGITPSSVAQDAAFAIEAPEGKTFADGAVLKLKNVSNVLANDLAVIVGVRRRMGIDDDIASGDAETVPGSFTFAYTAPYTEVYMHMLLDHIYSKLTVSFSVDENYDKLRTIKITGCKLKTTSGSTAYDVTVPLTANETGASPVGTVTYTPASGAASGDAVLNVGDGGLTLSTTPQVVEAYLCPSGSAGKYEMETTYDVYDKEGNRTRENCVVTNSISMSSPARGQAFILNAVVSPTYLYQLSSPDFDTPNIKLQ